MYTHTYIYTHTYMYIYTHICVCVCQLKNIYKSWPTAVAQLLEHSTL